jgi:hypothetical protein
VERGEGREGTGLGHGSGGGGEGGDLVRLTLVKETAMAQSSTLTPPPLTAAVLPVTSTLLTIKLPPIGSAPCSESPPPLTSALLSEITLSSSRNSPLLTSCTDLPNIAQVSVLFAVTFELKHQLAWAVSILCESTMPCWARRGQPAP